MNNLVHGFVCFVVGGCACLGVVIGAQQEDPTVVECNRLIVRNDKGDVVIEAGSNTMGGVIRLFDRRARKFVELDCFPEGPRLRVFNNAGDQVLQLRNMITGNPQLRMKRGEIVVTDFNNYPAVGIGAGWKAGEGGEIHVFDGRPKWKPGDDIQHRFCIRGGAPSTSASVEFVDREGKELRRITQETPKK